MKPIFKVSVLLITTLPLIVQAGQSHFDRMDIFELEVATDPQVSPDGSQVAYVRQSMDVMTDSARNHIWVIGSNGANHRPLVAGSGSYSSPRWSPSADRIAYISEVKGHGAEIWVRWMDTGQTALLTNLNRSPASLTWSPDGSSLAFTMLVPAKGPSFATPPEKPAGAKWAPPVTAVDRLTYRFDGLGYLETGNTHVFVVPAEGSTPRQVTSGAFNHQGPLSWSADGQTIVFSANRIEDWEHQVLESEIWAVSVSTGTLAQLIDRTGPDSSPQYSPDGSKIVYLGFDDEKLGYHNARVHLMDADGSNKRVLTGDFDRSIDDVQWAGGAKRLYVQYDNRGRTHIAALTMAGKISDLTGDVGSVSLGRPYTSGGFTAAGNGNYAFTSGRPDRPADIATGRRNGKPQRITHLNEDLFSHKTLGAVEEILWTSSVGDLQVQGWLVKPPDFDPTKTYPLVLEIHGGPFAAYGPHFSAEGQLYAAAGYVVLFANPRGSTSYGAEFANEIHHAYPGQDYDDLMSGVDAVIDKGYIDSNQLFVTGGSGGGVLTAWIVGKTDRFAAAVSAKPVINWTSMTLNSDIPGLVADYWFGKPPWEDHENYWRRSPLSLVGNVTTPTMLLTGEADYRTPISESEQFYQALKYRKVEAALIRVPEASHGIAAKPSHLIAKIDNILGWFGRYRNK